jgi:hypothetical protein
MIFKILKFIQVQSVRKTAGKNKKWIEWWLKVEDKEGGKMERKKAEEKCNGNDKINK